MFTARLNELLKETNTSKAALSKATGIPLTTMWGWFEKNTQPAADKVVKIADYFEVSTDYLLGRESDIGIVNANANLAQDEIQLLVLYRQMNFQDKNQLIGFAKALVY